MTAELSADIWEYYEIVDGDGFFVVAGDVAFRETLGVVKNVMNEMLTPMPSPQSDYAADIYEFTAAAPHPSGAIFGLRIFDGFATFMHEFARRLSARGWSGTIAPNRYRSKLGDLRAHGEWITLVWWPAARKGTDAQIARATSEFMAQRCHEFEFRTVGDAPCAGFMLADLAVASAVDETHYVAVGSSPGLEMTISSPHFTHGSIVARCDDGSIDAITSALMDLMTSLSSDLSYAAVTRLPPDLVKSVSYGVLMTDQWREFDQFSGVPAPFAVQVVKRELGERFTGTDHWSTTGLPGDMMLVESTRHTASDVVDIDMASFEPFIGLAAEPSLRQAVRDVI